MSSTRRPLRSSLRLGCFSVCLTILARSGNSCSSALSLGRDGVTSIRVYFSGYMRWLNFCSAMLCFAKMLLYWWDVLAGEGLDLCNDSTFDNFFACVFQDGAAGHVTFTFAFA